MKITEFRKDQIFADFETTQPDKDKTVHVFRWGFLTSWNENYFEGYNVDTFLMYLEEITLTRKKGISVWFHNGGRFDLHFLIFAIAKKYKPWFTRSKKDIEKRKTSEWKEKQIKTGKMLPGHYKYSINENKTIIEIQLTLADEYTRIKKGKKITENKTITFKDSNLLFPSTLDGYAETLKQQFPNNDFKKIDYKGYLKVNRVYSNKVDYRNNFPEWKQLDEYLKRDCLILKTFLAMMNNTYPAYKWSSTIGATAYNDFLRRSLPTLIEIAWEKLKIEVEIKIYKRFKHYRVGKTWKYSLSMARYLFDKIFPVKWLTNLTPEGQYEYKKVRHFYRGGLTHVNPNYQAIHFKEEDGLKFDYYDINSSYPNSMMSIEIPYGIPHPSNTGYNLYKITAKSKIINENGLPFLPLKSVMINSEAESSLKLNYPSIINRGSVFYVDEIENNLLVKYYKGKWKKEKWYSFKTISSRQIFEPFIKYWWDKKNEATTKKIPVLRLIAKLMLNSLYGKFGQRNDLTTSIFNYNEKTWKWEREEVVKEASKYLPIAVAITSYARRQLVESVGYNYKKFVYCDTDSIICLRNTINFETGEEIGKWKKEDEIKSLVVRCKKQYSYINFNNHQIVRLASFNLDRTNNPTFEELLNGCIIKNQLRPSQKIVNYGKFLENYQKDLHPVWHASYTSNREIWFYKKIGEETKEEHYIKMGEIYKNRYSNYKKEILNNFSSSSDASN